MIVPAPLCTRALHGVDADAADADDHHDVADLHVGRRTPTEPQPVGTPQPISAALSQRDVGVDLDHRVDRDADVRREGPEVGHAADALPARVDAVRAVGGHAGEHAGAERRTCSSARRRTSCSARRTAGRTVTTWSPGLEVVDLGPTSVTTPAPSWPPSTGAHGSGITPSSRCSSEWQMPEAASWIITSPALGRIDLDLLDAPARVGPGLPEQRSHASSSLSPCRWRRVVILPIGWSIARHVFDGGMTAA